MRNGIDTEGTEKERPARSALKANRDEEMVAGGMPALRLLRLEKFNGYALGRVAYGDQGD